MRVDDGAGGALSPAYDDPRAHAHTRARVSAHYPTPFGAFRRPVSARVGLRDRFVPEGTDDIIKTTLGCGIRLSTLADTDEIAGFQQNSPPARRGAA